MANELEQWGVKVLENGEGAMIVQPPPVVLMEKMRAKEFPITSRRIALLESSHYMNHDEAVSIATTIVERHNASLCSQ